MSYVDSNLMQGEVVVHRAKLHYILFLKPVFFSIALIFFGISFKTQYPQQAFYAHLSFILPIFFLLPAYIEYISSEFAVTNKRVIMKTGFITRQTMETLLQKIEAISVDQSVLGRILNYGSVQITGTGGTEETFTRITQPLDFRRIVQEQTDAKENAQKA